MAKKIKKTNKAVDNSTQKKPNLFKRMGKGIADATCATGRGIKSATNSTGGAAKKLVTREDPNVKEQKKLKKLDAKIKKETQQYADRKKAMLEKAEQLKAQAKQIEELTEDI